MHDQMNSLHFAAAIPPAAATADDTPWVPSIISMAGNESMTALIHCGALVDADAIFEVTCEHGNDPALADTSVPAVTDLAGTEALASFTFASGNDCRKLDYIGVKQYFRFTVTPSANTGNAFLSATAILGNPHYRPTANPPQTRNPIHNPLRFTVMTADGCNCEIAVDRVKNGGVVRGDIRIHGRQGCRQETWAPISENPL